MVWRSWGHVIVATILALPATALAVAALARWRVSRGWARSEATRRSVGEVGAIAGTAPWLWMVFTPTSGERHVVLVPLRDLVELAAGARPSTVIVQVGGNLLVLAALGAFLPMRSATLARAPRVVLVAAGTSALIELLQYVLDLGRVSSVDDVILNVTGAVIGATLTRRWWATR
jgi:hypothetical protein